MIFMTMRQNKTGKLVTSLLDKAQVRQHDINPRHAVIREGNAKIHHQPTALIVVEIGVHANFTGSTKRHEKKVGVIVHM